MSRPFSSIDARRLLDGHDLDGEDRAGIGVLPPGARAAAGRAAGGEAADRRLLARRRMEAEFPAVGRAERPVDVEEPRARPRSARRRASSRRSGRARPCRGRRRRRAAPPARNCRCRRRAPSAARDGARRPRRRGSPPPWFRGRTTRSARLSSSSGFRIGENQKKSRLFSLTRRRIVGGGDAGDGRRGTRRSSTRSRPPQPARVEIVDVAAELDEGRAPDDRRPPCPSPRSRRAALPTVAVRIEVLRLPAELDRAVGAQMLELVDEVELGRAEVLALLHAHEVRAGDAA